MKFKAGTFETVLVAVAECLSLNFGEAAKGLFSIRHKKLALIEGELNIPGNEIAYIVKAQEIFS